MISFLMKAQICNKKWMLLHPHYILTQNWLFFRQIMQFRKQNKCLNNLKFLSLSDKLIINSYITRRGYGPIM